MKATLEGRVNVIRCEATKTAKRESNGDDRGSDKLTGDTKKK